MPWEASRGQGIKGRSHTPRTAEWGVTGGCLHGVKYRLHTHGWPPSIPFADLVRGKRYLLGTLLIPALLLLMLALLKVPCDTCLRWKEVKGSPVPCSSYAMKDTQSPEGTWRGAAAGIESCAPSSMPSFPVCLRDHSWARMESSKTKSVLTATKNRSPIFKHLCKEGGWEEEAGFGYSLEVMWAC